MQVVILKGNLFTIIRLSYLEAMQILKVISWTCILYL